MAQWRKTSDILRDIQEARERVKDGTTEVAVSQAEARLFSQATRLIGLRLEHARATGRLEQGSADLPDLDLSEM